MLATTLLVETMEQMTSKGGIDQEIVRSNSVCTQLNERNFNRFMVRLVVNAPVNGQKCTIYLYDGSENDVKNFHLLNQ